MDKLEKIFGFQQELQDIVRNKNGGRYFYKNYEQFDGQKLFMIATAIIHESVELQRETNWKWWKDPKDINIDKIREEAIDIYHFIIQILLHLDIEPEELFKEYEKKWNTNVKRQNEGY